MTVHISTNSEFGESVDLTTAHMSTNIGLTTAEPMTVHISTNMGMATSATELPTIHMSTNIELTTAEPMIVHTRTDTVPEDSA